MRRFGFALLAAPLLAWGLAAQEPSLIHAGRLLDVRTGKVHTDQILKESIPTRTLRAAAAARSALLWGFTTLRDLGTEGAGYADVDLKKAIEAGVVPGPRLFVAGKAFSATGTYPLQEYAWELDLPSGVRVVDGVEAIRVAVRDEARRGADWVKVYVDRTATLGGDGRLRIKTVLKAGVVIRQDP